MAIPSTLVSASVIIVFVILMGVNNSLNATNRTLYLLIIATHKFALLLCGPITSILN